MQCNLNKSFKEVDELIKGQRLNQALNILRQLENTRDQDSICLHKQYMQVISTKYLLMKELESKNILDFDLALLYLGFDFIDKAESIVKKIYLDLGYEKFEEKISGFDNYSKSLLWNTIAHYFYDKNSELAIKFFENELKMNSESFNASLAISELSFRRGELKKAIFFINNALSLEKNNSNAFNNLMMMLHYDEDLSVEDIRLTADKFVEDCFPEFIGTEKKVFKRDLNKSRLNIGFVSGDLRKHALFYWLRDFLDDSNFRNLNIFLYHNDIEDHCSERYKSQVKNWRNIKALNDDEMEVLIKLDEIDILIDLSGHTKNNRLSFFARKFVPVQMTWLGQSGPMGLKQIDYMLVGQHQLFGEEENKYSEKIIRFPAYIAPYSYKNDFDSGEINPKIPFYENGYFSFACVNNQIKITEKVLDSWSSILKSVPNSKLLIKNQSMDDISTQEYIRNYFQERDINSDRIKLHGFSSREEYLRFFNKIDLALDPFPIGGGTTSLDTLLMGVPILTISGSHLAHRFTAPLNKILGLDNLVTHSKAEYVQRAVELALKPELVQSYKNVIIKEFRSSDICNVSKFSKVFEEKMFLAWKEH